MSVTTEWLIDRPSPQSNPVGYVVLRFRIYEDPETGLYQGECLDLDAASFGESVEEALDATMEATALYLETIDDLGERDRIFKERGIEIVTKEPSDDTTLEVVSHPSEIISVQRLAVVVAA